MHRIVIYVPNHHIHNNQYHFYVVKLNLHNKALPWSIYQRKMRINLSNEEKSSHSKMKAHFIQNEQFYHKIYARDTSIRCVAVFPEDKVRSLYR